MSWGRFSFTPQQGPTLTRRTRVFPAHKPAPRNVVVIDEDDDGDVIIMEHAVARESASAAAALGSEARKGGGSSGDVINIDDDEDEKDGTRGDKAGPSMSRASGSPVAMTPGRGSPRNRYGFDCSYDSSESNLTKGWDSDTDDGSDCEILDDTAGTAREMWETAASRKKPPHGVDECEDGGATAFASCAGLETQPGKYSEHLFGAERHPDESMSWFYSAASKYGSQNSSDSTKESPGHAQSSSGTEKGVHGPSVPNTEECSNGDFSSINGRESAQNRNGSGKDIPTECHLNDNISRSFSDARKEGLQNNTGRSKDHHDQFSAPNVKECSMVGSEKASRGVQLPRPDESSAYNFAPANRFFSGIWSVDRNDGSPPIFVSTPEKVDETIPDDVYSQKYPSPPEASYNTIFYSAQDNGLAKGKDLLQDPEELGRFASVIGEREKHKESVEYKRAAEEEWASRHRQLQIQAEEAKKLRKRKKAEAQRLLDMEKRQKQRLQEVRESQRKNEEAIQLKERYRATVGKELEDIERRHCDMTSILHALGISVEGGEVKAFKQALLKFHPDRVSRNDIYQQVKAEETFKFISRLKEKLPRLS